MCWMRPLRSISSALGTSRYRSFLQQAVSHTHIALALASVLLFPPPTCLIACQRDFESFRGHTSTCMPCTHVCNTDWQSHLPAWVSQHGACSAGSVENTAVAWGSLAVNLVSPTMSRGSSTTDGGPDMNSRGVRPCMCRLSALQQRPRGLVCMDVGCWRCGRGGRRHRAASSRTASGPAAAAGPAGRPARCRYCHQCTNRQ